jgi:hypothetical protein
MAEEIKKDLTPNEIQFMEFMISTVIPNRKDIDISTLKMAGDLIGTPINTSCRTCAQKGGVDLLNIFNGLKPKYDLYVKKTTQRILEEINKEAFIPINKRKKKL